VRAVSIIRAMRSASKMMAVTLMLETVHTSETSVYSNETILRYIPEAYQVHIRRHEDLKSQKNTPVLIYKCLIETSV
jgi:hypothetical protein